jgi:hypothetical protein
MSKQTVLLALCYELAMEVVKRWPRLRFSPWFPLLVSHCLPFWTEWKTARTMQKVDEQAKELVKQWEREEREVVAEKLASKAQELFPQATITPLPDAVVPSVMIIHEAPESASDDVKALGGELRITWQLQ